MQLLTSSFKTILTTSVMAIIMISFIFLIKFLLKDRLKPRWGYLLWMLLLVRLVMPWSPESALSVFNLISLERIEKVIDDQKSTPFPSVETGSYNEEANNIQIEMPASTQKGIDSGISFSNGLSIMWALGIVLVALYHAIVYIRFAIYQRKESRLCHDRTLLKILEDCKQSLSIQHKIQLLETSIVATPSLYGMIRPKILFPAELKREFSEQEWKYIFLHELSHIKRRDVWVNSLMSLILLFHWFNPMIWIAYFRMREDQEIACDSLALTRCQGESRSYASTLIKLLEYWKQPIKLSGVVNVTGNIKYLKRRVSMIVLKKHSYGWSIIGVLVLAIVASLTLTGAKSNSDEQQRVEQVVHDFYRSLQEKNSELYLSSIAHSQHPSTIYFANNLKYTKDTTIEYEIIQTEKINNSKYEVSISKTVDGLEYPPIPYDVILEEDGWKYDPSTITIYPKAALFQSIEENGVKIAENSGFYRDVLSENENFIIKKSEKSSLR